MTPGCHNRHLAEIARGWMGSIGHYVALKDRISGEPCAVTADATNPPTSNLRQMAIVAAWVSPEDIAVRPYLGSTTE
ncbi:hypothetical protein VN97_g4153 [Penicillium thymicola]|uniref:Uncharacterized protein n=1 Tax=Penicillium thymicola TaxID=293382 RepID=A0AAI9TL58_PENTH|nr:hypothetical protein VN97_g4153 [Penicillium thymicola]